MQEIVPNISRPKIFVNRELSWMEFNLRVLSESLNPKIPLMERLKFLSIYFSNLDEFFMVRVGSLHDQSIVEPDKLDDKTGLNAADQIDAILNKANQINPIAQKAWDSICLELRGKQNFSALIDIKNEIRWELRERNNAKTDIFILAFQHADNKRFLVL